MRSVSLKFFFRAAVMLSTFSYSAFVAAADNCPAVACDCGSLPSPEWRQECLASEKELKTVCAANQQEPKGFCGLHGPDAKPLPLATQLSAIELLPHAAEIESLIKQLDTAQWSLREDLVTLQKQSDAGNWTNLTQIAKMFDAHVEAAFVLERRIAASWLALGSSRKAEAVVEQYVKNAKQLAVDSQKMGNALWTSAKLAEGDTVKSRQFLAQRLLRTSGKLYEHQAYAFSTISDQGGAAKAWQDAARLAELQVQLETMGTQKVEYLTFYRQQAAARWNRASLYWALSKNDNKAAEALNQAKQFVGRLSVNEGEPSTEKVLPVKP